VRLVVFSPDGRWVAAGSGEWTGPGHVQVWRTDTWEQAIQLEQESIVLSIAFSPDGGWLATADRSAVRIWKMATGKEMSPIVHAGMVTAIAFSPDGRWLISVSNPGAPIDRVHLWSLALSSAEEAATGQVYELAHDRAQVNAIAFGPDGQWMASASSDGIVRVWSLGPGAPGEVAQTEHQHPVWDVAFSPDGQWIASVSGFIEDDHEPSGQARVWEAATGRERARLQHRWPVADVAFGADGRWLLTTTGIDGTLRSWLWQPDDLAAEACARLARNLTPEEWTQFISAEAPHACTCPNLPPCVPTP
jgi:WD40 repeat protein